MKKKFICLAITLFIAGFVSVVAQSLTVPIVGSVDGKSFVSVNAGADISQSNANFTLSAALPSVGTGIWSLVSGAAIITNPSSPTTTVTGVPIGETVLRWTVTVGLCVQSADVKLTVVPLPSLSVKVFLQGAYAGAKTMRNDLNTMNLIPLTFGAETTTQAVLNNYPVVDWMTIELRDAGVPAQILFSRAGLLLTNGKIVATDGISPVVFTEASAGNYFISVKHRNHLKIRTLTTVLLKSGTNSLDFSDGSTYAVSALIPLESGVYGMFAGDINQDGVIDAVDRSNVWNNRNTLGYGLNDCSLSGAVDAFDRSFIWNNKNLSAGFY